MLVQSWVPFLLEVIHKLNLFERKKLIEVVCFPPFPTTWISWKQIQPQIIISFCANLLVCLERTFHMARGHQLRGARDYCKYRYCWLNVFLQANWHRRGPMCPLLWGHGDVKKHNWLFITWMFEGNQNFSM